MEDGAAEDDAVEEPRAVTPSVLDVLAFGCELALLVTVALAGAGLGGSRVLHVILAVALPVLVGLVWGLRMAPRAPRRWPDPTRLVVQVGLFAGGGALAVHAGHAVLGVVVGVLGCAVFAATRVARPTA